MENTIIQELSLGSPMLAYGSSKLSPKRRLIVLIIGILLLIATPILVITCIFLFGSTNLPSQTLLSLSLTPSSINAKLNGALVSELPAPWRSALETDTSLPVILGLAKTKNGSIASFAIIPRTVSISQPDHTTIHKSGLIKIILNDSIETKKQPYRSFLKVLQIKKKSNAGWMIHEQLMQLIANEPSQVQKNQSAVYGSITDNRGVIFLPSENTISQNPDGIFFVILGKDASQNNLISNALLTQGINTKNIHSPNTLNLRGDGTVIAQWLDVSESELPILAAANGKTTSTPFVLPDADVVKQISPNLDQAGETTSQVTTSNGWMQTSKESVTWKSSCPGEIRFSINGEALKNLLVLLRATPSWREKIQSFTITSKDKQNIFCFNE